MSNRAIAEAANVSHTAVSNIRGAQVETLPTESDQGGTVIGKDNVKRVKDAQLAKSPTESDRPPRADIDALNFRLAP